ncbi:hypothetical protein ACIBSV_02290 [Embleya sp. NPDC050154]|uniref:hypothetical protein n=1 Tax=Embleya sp. NPDC050154 TaxID=3363988 RepID=UPI0037ADBAE6
MVLLVDFFMAGRSSEPAGLNLHDVEEIRGGLLDEQTGELVETEALLVHTRVSKTDVRATGVVTRILAQPDTHLCPVRAMRAWRAVLDEHGQDVPGPLVRRIDKHGRIGTDAGGRRPKDARRAGGVTAETIRTTMPPSYPFRQSRSASN